jgi:cephalosporin-C deacetylase-like acetyl esterase
MRRHIVCLFCLLLPLCVGTARADSKPDDALIQKYLDAETEKLSQRFLDSATTLAEWQARRPRLHQEYLDMLGLWPLPEKTPLHATVTGQLDRDGFIVEKLHFQSRPGLYVTGNLYRPKHPAGRLPTILYVCGHSHMGRDGNKTAYQDHGQWFARHGYVCLTIDTLQLGEIAGIHHGTYNLGRWWWQARGYTPAGVECWNGIRAIDYLVSRPDVDPTRIGVTGISGGGAATFWIAAADERAKCAVPVSGMSDLESYVTHKVINGHCDCMFLINSYGWEWTTIAALIAPRPLFFCNSDKDSIFPMDGNERIIARLRKLYQLYGHPELVDAHVSHGGHAYRPDLRIAVYQWINKHLKHDTGLVEDANYPPIPGKDLRVFPKDTDLPTDAVNGSIDETFVPQAQVRLPESGEFEAWKERVRSDLLHRSFARMQQEVVDLPLVTTPLKGTGEGRPRTVFVDLSPTDDTASLGWALPYAPDGPAVVLYPRGCWQTGWTHKSPPNYVERAHALLGRTVDEGRARDILRAVGKSEQGVRVVGRGKAGILAAYAALFEPRITEVVVIDPPVSHREGPIFLNVLRVLDIPDALGLLAPRRLTLVNAHDKEFDRTAQIYRLAGADTKLQRK